MISQSVVISAWCRMRLVVFLTMAYVVAPLHSLVDNFKMKNKRHPKVGVTFMHSYLILWHKILIVTWQAMELSIANMAHHFWCHRQWHKYIWIYAWMLDDSNCQYDVHYIAKLHKHGGWQTWTISIWSCSCYVVTFAVVVWYFVPTSGHPLSFWD